MKLCRRGVANILAGNARVWDVEFGVGVPFVTPASYLSLAVAKVFCVSGVLPQGFNHRVMKRRTHLFDCLVLAVRPGAVGQQSYRKLAIRVDPQGCAGVTEVSE